MIETAKKLVQAYKNITLEQLEKEWNGCGEKTLYNITGFGSTEKCPLCSKAKVYCDRCIHKYRKDINQFIEAGDFYCMDENYREMSDAETPKDLYNAIQKRIAYFNEIFERRQF